MLCIVLHEKAHAQGSYNIVVCDVADKSLLQALKSITIKLKHTSRWYELHLHNYIQILSLCITTLFVIVRAVIHSAAVQTTGNSE